MNSSQELYYRLIDTIRPLVNVSPVGHLHNWIWIVVGLLQANSMALSQIALHIPGQANAESRMTTVRRWLQDRQIDVWALYQPVLAHVLTGWRAVEATVILDGVEVLMDVCKFFGCRCDMGVVLFHWCGRSSQVKVSPKLKN
jgi:hypothetical protein